ARVPLFHDVESTRHHPPPLAQEFGSDQQGPRHAHRLAAQHHRRGGVAGAGRRSALMPRRACAEKRTARGGVAPVEGRRVMKSVKLATMMLAAAMAVCAPAAAQEQYPSRLITVVVPLTPGTTIDILARLFAESLSKRFGQQCIVAKRPGAGGRRAARAVASAPADGYTVLLANSGHTILGTLNKNLPFDPIGDFAAVSLIGDAPTLVNVAPSLGVRTLMEFA